jgi:hypothetical protein
MQQGLGCYLSEERAWDYLLGLPLSDREKNWDSYGDYYPDRTRSCYATGRFGFAGRWRAGRFPNWKFFEVQAFAHEPCDMKEKWKRMIIWNHYFEGPKTRLEVIRAETGSERKHYVIGRLLDLIYRGEPPTLHQGKDPAKAKLESEERQKRQRLKRTLYLKRKSKTISLLEAYKVRTLREAFI